MDTGTQDSRLDAELARIMFGDGILDFCIAAFCLNYASGQVHPRYLPLGAALSVFGLPVLWRLARTRLTQPRIGAARPRTGALLIALPASVIAVTAAAGAAFVTAYGGDPERWSASWLGQGFGNLIPAVCLGVAGVFLKVPRLIGYALLLGPGTLAASSLGASVPEVQVLLGVGLLSGAAGLMRILRFRETFPRAGVQDGPGSSAGASGDEAGLLAVLGRLAEADALFLSRVTGLGPGRVASLLAELARAGRVGSHEPEDRARRWFLASAACGGERLD